MSFGTFAPVFFFAILFAGPAVAADGDDSLAKIVTPCVERQDEIWLVSTRNIDCPADYDPTTLTLDVRRHDHASGWVTTSLDDLLAQPPLPTVIYVHGNRVQWCEAFEHGWRTYRHLAGCCTAPARFRFVIWTWPSDQIRGPLRDVRAKADRADDETIVFGSFLSRFNPATPVGLIGYSYGCRVISGGLQLLAGGSLDGRTLQAGTSEKRAVRVAMLAAAIDYDALCPEGEDGQALPQMDRLLVLFNSCDPALERYHLVDRCSRSPALGYVGLPGECVAAAAGSIRQVDASDSIGRSHSEIEYFCSSNLMAEVCQTLFAD